MFTLQKEISAKIAPSIGPRTWPPEKARFGPSSMHTKVVNGGEPRVRTKFTLVPPPMVDPCTTSSTVKMADFRRQIPVTYPTGKNVLPPPANLPLFPAPPPTSTPMNFGAKALHIIYAMMEATN